MAYNIINMKNVIKKLLVTVFLLTLVMFFIPTKTYAETSFGGMHLVTFDSTNLCDCSGNSHWILDYKTMSLLKLYYSEGQSKVFANNDIDYGLFEVGTYSSGGGQDCKMYEGEDCNVIFTNDGTYGNMPGTGTSMNSILKSHILASLIQSASVKLSALLFPKNVKVSL